MGTVWALAGTLGLLLLIGGIKAALGITEPVRGYSSEWCERYLGSVKVGGEAFVGRYVQDVNGMESYLVMIRNDDLEPPYMIVRTVKCPTCEIMILPLSGCCCNLSTKAPKGLGKPIPEFKDSAPGSLTHKYLA